MSDFTADPEAIDKGAETVRDSTEQATQVAEYAREADPDIWTWGLPGTFLAAPIYFGIANILHGQFKDVGTTIENYADKVKACAEAYREADDATVTDLDAIESEVEAAAS